MKALSVNLMCVSLRNNVDIWVEVSRSQNIRNYLKSPNPPKFIEIGDQIINTADIVGVFSPETMNDLIERRKGNWKCPEGFYHGRNEECMGHRKPEPFIPPKVGKKPTRETLDSVRKTLAEKLQMK